MALPVCSMLIQQVPQFRLLVHRWLSVKLLPRKHVFNSHASIYLTLCYYVNRLWKLYRVLIRWGTYFLWYSTRCTRAASQVCKKTGHCTPEFWFSMPQAISSFCLVTPFVCIPKTCWIPARQWLKCGCHWLTDITCPILCIKLLSFSGTTMIIWLPPASVSVNLAQATFLLVLEWRDCDMPFRNLKKANDWPTGQKIDLFRLHQYLQLGPIIRNIIRLLFVVN